MTAPEAIPAPTGAREGWLIDPTLVDCGSFERALSGEPVDSADPIIIVRQWARDLDVANAARDAAALRWAIDQLFLLYATRGKFGAWEGR